jgi:hypothetical protein
VPTAPKWSKNIRTIPVLFGCEYGTGTAAGVRVTKPILRPRLKRPPIKHLPSGNIETGVEVVLLGKIKRMFLSHEY